MTSTVICIVIYEAMCLYPGRSEAGSQGADEVTGNKRQGMSLRSLLQKNISVQMKRALHLSTCLVCLELLF